MGRKWGGSGGVCPLNADLPLHQYLQISRQFIRRFLLLAHGRMPAGPVAQFARLRGEVEAVDFRVACLSAFRGYRVQGTLDVFQCLAVHHGAGQQHDFGVRIGVAQMGDEVAVGLLHQVEVVAVLARVVRAQVEAHHIGRVEAVVPQFARVGEHHLLVHGRHAVLAARGRRAVVAVHADAGAGDYQMLGVQGACRAGGVGIEMIFRLIGERVVLVVGFHAIAAGDGVADELDASFGQRRSLGQGASLVHVEAFEHRLQFIALQDVHHPDAVYTLGQTLGERQDGVRFGEADAVGELVVNLHHEVPAARFGLHPERGSFEVGEDADAGISEGDGLGEAVADASHVGDACIVGGDKRGRTVGGRLGGQCRGAGKHGQQQAAKSLGHEFVSFHCCIVLCKGSKLCLSLWRLVSIFMARKVGSKGCIAYICAHKPLKEKRK